jgi:hypothetical protein
VLFHELCAVHDDDFGHRRLVLPKPRLQWGLSRVSAPPPALLIDGASAGHLPR